MNAEHPTVHAVLEAYAAVADRHAEADQMHAQAYADAARPESAGGFPSGVETGPTDD